MIKIYLRDCSVIVVIQDPLSFQGQLAHDMVEQPKFIMIILLLRYISSLQIIADLTFK